MTKEEFLKLIDSYPVNNISPEDADILKRISDGFQECEEWDETLLGPEDLLESKLSDALKVAIHRKGKRKYGYPTIHIRLWHKIAAVLVMFLTTGILINFFSKQEPLSISANVKDVDLGPGSNVATLTLEDGSTINLNDSDKNEILLSNGLLVHKNDTGLLVYNSVNIPTGRNLTYNTLSTPKGGEYQVILPDGSKVWLNSGTSLRFPTTFIGKERRVELTGEAYFEVAKDKSKPFKVDVKGMEVTALGTEFNVNAYEDDEFVSTTLLEGSVLVQKEKENVLLEPGQNARLDKAIGVLIKGQSDPGVDIAWKDGYFVFNNEDIRSIMVKLSRWYNAEIEYESDVVNKKFTAVISRRSNISEILEILENTGSIHFKIEGRRVKVMS